jgi:hypothetical protein
MEKLRAYSESSMPAKPAQPAPKPSQPTAADILQLNRKRPAGKQTAISLEMEVDQYLSDPDQGSGIVEYWQVDKIFIIFCFNLLTYVLQEHEQRYPRIFQMAMDVIPIQASSVSCERVFSSGKQTMTPRRSRISPKLMEILQILKFSIRKDRSLSFTEGMSWSDELKEFELAARTVPPNDPEAYGRSLEDPGEDSDDLNDAIDDLRKDLEVLEEKLVKDLEDSTDDEEEEDDF